MVVAPGVSALSAAAFLGDLTLRFNSLNIIESKNYLSCHREVLSVENFSATFFTFL
jgi:hypothetical protein